jgi:hypothetical protein
LRHFWPLTVKVCPTVKVDLMIKVSSSKKASRKMLENPENLKIFAVGRKIMGEFPHFSVISGQHGPQAAPRNILSIEH